MAFTKAQEDALVKLANREIARPALEAAIQSAEDELAAIEAQLQTERDEAYLTANIAIASIEASYSEQIVAKRKSIEDAKATLVATTTP